MKKTDAETQRRGDAAPRSSFQLKSVARFLGRRVLASPAPRVAILIALVLIATAVWIRTGPLPRDLKSPKPAQSTVLFDRNGEVLYEMLSAQQTRSRSIRSDQIPPQVLQATLAAEDHRFFHHVGVDPRAVTRAAWTNLTRIGLREGGSTITQQVVRQVCRSCERRRSLRWKIEESVLALRLEHQLNKREIVALYLNSAPYGNQLDGITRASETYFGVKPQQLTIAQTALLAGLPIAPSRLDPYRNPAAALARQKRVLQRMFELGMLDRRSYDVARRERLQFRRPSRDSIAPHFVQHVLASFQNAAPARIHTTLDAGLQREVAAIIRQQEGRLHRHGANNVAVTVLENRTGEWLAWEGSGDYFSEVRSGAIDGVTSPRQPGSALKPFTYALAFDRGFSPAVALPDVPSHFSTAVEGVVYTPRNYDGIYRGALRARAALAGSENVPAVWLLSEIGPGSLLQFLRSSGFTTLPKTADYYGLGLTLGNAEVRLDELVAAYSTFARGGFSMPTTFIRTDATGRRGDGRTGRRRVMSPETAFWVTDILSDPEARAFIFGSGGSLDFPFPVAVKTGTSQSYRDNWTIGYTREFTVGVWVGNFDRTELRNSSGVTGAAPIFHEVVMAAHRRYGSEASMAAPESLVRGTICALSGLRAHRDCPVTQSEWLRRADRIAKCDWHSAGGTSWPSEYRDWARREGLLETAAEAEESPTSRAPQAASRGFAIVSPADGATYLIDPTLRREFQALPLRISGDTGAVRWSVNGEPVGEPEWPLRPGKHFATAVDGSGVSATVSFVVK